MEVISTKMKKVSLLILMFLLATIVASAQVTPVGPYGAGGYTPSGTYTYANPKGASGATDVLGAHNGYGRGCVMCHAPHSGAFGNGKALSGDPQNGMYALWGQDNTPLYGQTYNFSGDGKATYQVTLPSNLNAGVHDANTVILLCLSCHDGALTSVGMMQGQTVETLPIVGGTAPTLLGRAKPSGGGAYSNDHPVGPGAVVKCGGGYNWDCVGTTAISMTGTASGEFINNYPASFWNTNGTGGVNATNVQLATFGTTLTAVTCTTCHDQHSMTVFTNNKGSFATMFFIRGQYTPNANGNSVAQFCRNCHGGESNEAHGLTDVPTI